MMALDDQKEAIQEAKWGKWINSLEGLPCPAASCYGLASIILEQGMHSLPTWRHKTLKI